MKNKYLFILSLPYSGSTVLYKLIATSSNVSSLTDESQHLPGIQEYYGPRRWYGEPQIDWTDVKHKLHNYWDLNKSILMEKSPPNLIHAFEIEKIFKPSYFIVLIRNPYANCEGLQRRNGYSIQRAAQFWKKCAKIQIHNIKGLENVYFLTYEKMVESPEVTKQDILRFLPDIEHIDVNSQFNVHSIEGQQARKLFNYNSRNILHLSPSNIHEINNILWEDPDVVQYFGYDFLSPNITHAIRYWTVKIYNGIIRRGHRFFIKSSTLMG